MNLTQKLERDLLSLENQIDDLQKKICDLHYKLRCGCDSSKKSSLQTQLQKEQTRKQALENEAEGIVTELLN